jgi:hypothetical protein
MYRPLTKHQKEQRARKLEAMRRGKDRARMSRPAPGRAPDLPELRREVISMDLRTHGGKNWQIEPRIGYTSCRVRDMESLAVEFTGTMKQCLRWMSRQAVRRLGARNLQ